MRTDIAAIYAPIERDSYISFETQPPSAVPEAHRGNPTAIRMNGSQRSRMRSWATPTRIQPASPIDSDGLAITLFRWAQRDLGNCHVPHHSELGFRC